MPLVDLGRARSEIRLAVVLELLGWQPPERCGEQVRGPCPLHGPTSSRSRSFSAHLGRGVWHCFRCGASGNALELWARATGQGLYQAVLDLYDRLGDAYLRSGQYSQAQEALNRAVLLEPNSTGPFILLGETFLKLKQPITALHYLDHAEKMDPSNYITHNLLGQAYRATGQVAAANREFKLVVDLQHRDDPKPAER